MAKYRIWFVSPAMGAKIDKGIFDIPNGDSVESFIDYEWNADPSYYKWKKVSKPVSRNSSPSRKVNRSVSVTRRGKRIKRSKDNSLKNNWLPFGRHKGIFRNGNPKAKYQMKQVFDEAIYYYKSFSDWNFDEEPKIYMK